MNQESIGSYYIALAEDGRMGDALYDKSRGAACLFSRFSSNSVCCFTIVENQLHLYRKMDSYFKSIDDFLECDLNGNMFSMLFGAEKLKLFRKMYFSLLAYEGD